MTTRVEREEMVELPAPSRTRNAAATRQAILDAAHNRFAKEGYDGASLREIAADAKVDAALVSRYFGSKEELFVEVLNCAPDASDLFEGTLSDFGTRVATKILDDRDVDQGVEYLLIMLRSASSPNRSRITMARLRCIHDGSGSVGANRQISSTTSGR